MMFKLFDSSGNLSGSAKAPTGALRDIQLQKHPLEHCETFSCSEHWLWQSTYHGMPSAIYRGMVAVFSFLIVQVHFTFCQLKVIILFPYLIKYYHIMFISFVFWLGSDWLSLLFSCSLYFFLYSRLSSYLLTLFLCLISFLLFLLFSIIFL